MDPHVFHNWQAVTDYEVAEALMHPHAQRVLAPFMAGTRSIAEAAIATGTSTQLVGYWVKRFTSLHLLQFICTRPGRGRPAKCYRATARGFFIPFETTNAQTIESLFTDQERPWTEQLHRDLVRVGGSLLGGMHRWGMCVSASGEAPCLRFAPNPQLVGDVEASLLGSDAPALWTAWAVLKLDFADAKALQRELAALLERYGAKGGSQDYLVRLALTPTLEHGQ
jgi:hypothetical protein